LATEIIKEINLYNSKYHLKIGILFFLFLILIFFLYKNINNNDSVPFVASFKYIEGIKNNSEVQIAGIKIGYVNKITISKDVITINGLIDREYNIPEDSILKIKSDGIFGKKALSIEPGFGEYFDKSKNQYVFNDTQNSYSVDMFLRYLNNINE
jgi:phospholipid/cholesterol/gamma-HCH transport system substrate-binding protein